MTILEDTNNPIAKHKNIHDYCDANGITIARTKLYVGDYTFPTNQSICVDTKKDLYEVSDNLDNKDKGRFRREILRAQSAGIKLIFLIEQSGISSVFDVASWDNPRLQKWIKVNNAHKEGKLINVKIPASPPKSSPWIAQKMSEISRIHGVEWQFCDKSETGKRIIEILEGGSSG